MGFSAGTGTGGNCAKAWVQASPVVNNPARIGVLYFFIACWEVCSALEFNNGCYIPTINLRSAPHPDHD